MMVAKQSCEERRGNNVGVNKKRMEALNLPLLSQALKSSSSPKPSSTKQAKPRVVLRQLVVVRKSTHFANKRVAVDRVAIPRRIFGRQRELSNRVYASHEAQAEAQEKAEKLELGLEPVYPTFTKSILRPHVTGGFWLGLPIQFGFRNLPKRNAVMTLIDEDGDEYPTIYLVHKIGLTGGWKGFAVAHHLVVGDAVVFQLIRPTTFKVYIIRVKGSEEGT